MEILAMTCDRPAATARQPGEWRCANHTCRRYLGRVVNGVLVEPNHDRSNLPVVRFCPRCGRRNVRLQ